MAIFVGAADYYLMEDVARVDLDLNELEIDYYHQCDTEDFYEKQWQ